MAGLNKIILIGNVSSPPEAHFAVEGTTRSKFKLAVRTFASGTAGLMSVDIIAWGRLAEICNQELKAGQLALVEGSIRISSFSDQSGQRKWTTEVVAQNLQILDQKAAPAMVAAEEVEELPEDDLPF